MPPRSPWAEIDDLRIYERVLTAQEMRLLADPSDPSLDQNLDPDGDGASNLHEFENGSRADLPDTDGDGLLDAAEINGSLLATPVAIVQRWGSSSVSRYTSQPRLVDGDGDGLSDSEEVNGTRTDPEKADTDGDGLSDRSESQTVHTDPLHFDSDGDTMADGWELQHGFNPRESSDGNGNPDLDAWTNAQEYAAGTNPQIPNRADGSNDLIDTDGDGLSDYLERFHYGTNPNTAHTYSGDWTDAERARSGLLPPGPGMPGGTPRQLNAPPPPPPPPGSNPGPGFSPTGDADGDGRSNTDELRDKTNPGDAEDLSAKLFDLHPIKKVPVLEIAATAPEPNPNFDFAPPAERRVRVPKGALAFLVRDPGANDILIQSRMELAGTATAGTAVKTIVSAYDGARGEVKPHIGANPVSVYCYSPMINVTDFVQSLQKDENGYVTITARLQTDQEIRRQPAEPGTGPGDGGGPGGGVPGGGSTAPASFGIPSDSFPTGEPSTPEHPACPHSTGGYYASSPVWLILLPVEVNIEPHEPVGGSEGTYAVSCDEAETYIQLSAFLPGEDDQGNPAMVPVEDGTMIKWELMEGSASGSFGETETETKNGWAAVTLTTSRNPGDFYKVKAKIKKLGWKGALLENQGGTLFYEIETGVIEVVPGRAKNLTVAVSGEQVGSSMPADGMSEKLLTVTIKDDRGKIVAEGTDVYWHLKGVGRLEDVEDTTDANGQVTARLIAGTVAGEQKVEIEADGKTHTEIITNTPVAGGLNSTLGSLDMATGQSTTLTASFQNAADGAEVKWFTTKGQIVNAGSTTQNGQATATLRTAGATRTGDALVFVSVGGNVKMAKIQFTSSAPISVSASQPIIVGDATADGTVAVPKPDGTNESVPYHASSNITVSAPAYAGQVATVTLGGTYPAETVSFGLDTETAGITQDQSASCSLSLNGAVLDLDARQSGAGSLKFDGQSAAATLPSAVSFQVGAEDFSVTAWIKPTAVSGGTILAKAGEYSLALDAQGRPIFSVTTGSGTHSATASVPVPANQWTQVRGTVGKNGRVSVIVGTNTSEVGYTGQPVAGSSPVTIGSGFAGNIDSLKFVRGSVFGTPANAPWTVSGLNADGTVTLDAQGRAVFAVTGAGAMSDPVNPHGRRVSVRVSINPTETAEETVAVVPKSEYAVVSAMAGSLQVTTGGQTRALTDAERSEVVARHLSDFLASGQRASAVMPFQGGTLAANGDLGFRASIWMEETTDASGKVNHIMRSAIQGVAPEVAQQLNNQLAGLMTQAAARGDDSSFQAYIQEHGGELINSLYALSQQEAARFNALAQAFDGEQTWVDGINVAETYGEELVEDIGQIAAQENLPPNFAQRTLDWLNRHLPTNPITEWKNKAFNGGEDWLRKHLNQAVLDGKIEPQIAASVGYFWGLAKMVNQASTLATDPTAGVKMLAELTSTVVRAISGDAEARQVLLEMLPVYGTYRSFADANASWEAGNYFDSGTQMFQGTLGAVGDITLMSGVAIKSARLLTKLNKQLDVVRLKTAPKFKPSNARIDKAAMDFAKTRLEKRGYRDITPLTNNSNQGIDYVARKTLANGEDVWVHIEVKGHWKSGPPRLRGTQKSREDFVRSRLQNITTNGDGMWNPAKIDPNVLNKAQEALDSLDAGRKLHGLVFNVDYALSWFPGARGSVWYWPRKADNQPWNPFE